MTVPTQNSDRVIRSEATRTRPSPIVIGGFIFADIIGAKGYPVNYSILDYRNDAIASDTILTIGSLDAVHYFRHGHPRDQTRTYPPTQRQSERWILQNEVLVDMLFLRDRSR